MYNFKQTSLETSAVTKCFICRCFQLNVQYHSIMITILYRRSSLQSLV